MDDATMESAQGHLATPKYDLTLAPPYGTYRRVVDMRNASAPPTAEELVALLDRDPVCAVHVLRQVNSDAYSLRQSVTALDRAVSMLGYDAVCNTVFVETYAQKSEGAGSESSRRAYAYIIRSSVAAARIAGELGSFLKMPDRSTVIAAAIVHQVGRMALLSSDPTGYSALWTAATEPNGAPISLPPGIGREIVHFRTDYRRLGAEIASQWDFPPALRESIRYHADPERSEDDDRRVLLAVAVAQQTARSLYEPATELNRDQSAARVENALPFLAREHSVPRAQLAAFLLEVKGTAYEEAAAIQLFPPAEAE